MDTSKSLFKDEQRLNLDSLTSQIVNVFVAISPRSQRFRYLPLVFYLFTFFSLNRFIANEKLINYLNNKTIESSIKSFYYIFKFEELLMDSLRSSFQIYILVALVPTLLLTAVFALLVISRTMRERKEARIIMALFGFGLFKLAPATTTAVLADGIFCFDAHTNVAQIECGSSSQITLMIATSICLVWYLIIGSVFWLLYYNPSRIGNRIDGSFNSKWGLYLFLFQGFGAIIESSLEVIGPLPALLYYIGATYILYYATYQNEKFYSEAFSKLWLYFLQQTTWNYTVLFILYLLNDKQINFVIYWFLGALLLIINILTTRSKREIAYHIHSKNIIDDEVYIDHFDWYIDVIKRSDEGIKKDVVSLLGYVQHHKIHCGNLLCPLRFNRPKSAFNSYEEYHERKYGVVNHYTTYMYRRGVVLLFKKSIQMRLRYAYFLLENQNSPNQAQEQISVYSNSPYIGLTDRYKIMFLEKEIKMRLKASDEERVQKKNNIANLIISAKFKMILESLSGYLLQFWNNIAQDYPDLNLFFKLAELISFADNMLKDFETDQKLDELDNRSLKSYGYFLLIVYNDSDKAAKIFERLERRFSMSNNSSIRISSTSELTSYGRAIVIISGMKDDFCRIININSECSSMFRFTRAQLLQKPIDVLMPDSIGKQHLNFVSRYMQNMEGNMINKKREVLAKDKLGYLFPITIFVKALENSTMTKLHFVGFLEREKQQVPLVYLMTSAKGVILGISITAENIFHLKLSQIDQGIHLDDYFPHLFEELKNVANNAQLVTILNPKQNLVSHDKLGSKAQEIPNGTFVVDVIRQRFQTIEGHVFFLKFERGLGETSRRKVGTTTFALKAIGLMKRDEIAQAGEFAKFTKHGKIFQFGLSSDSQYIYKVRLSNNGIKSNDALKQIDHFNINFGDFTSPNAIDKQILSIMEAKSQELLITEKIQLLKLRGELFIKNEHKAIEDANADSKVSNSSINLNYQQNANMKDDNLEDIQIYINAEGKDENNSYKQITQNFRGPYSKKIEHPSNHEVKNGHKFMKSISKSIQKSESRKIILLIVGLAIMIFILIVLSIIWLYLIPSEINSGYNIIDSTKKCFDIQRCILAGNLLLALISSPNQIDEESMMNYRVELEGFTNCTLTLKQELSSYANFEDYAQKPINYEQQSNNYSFTINQGIEKIVSRIVEILHEEQYSDVTDVIREILQNGNNAIIKGLQETTTDSLSIIEDRFTFGRRPRPILLFLLILLLIMASLIFSSVFLIRFYKKLTKISSVYLKIRNELISEIIVSCERFVLQSKTESDSFERMEGSLDELSNEDSNSNVITGKYGRKNKRFKNLQNLGFCKLLSFGSITFVFCLFIILQVILQRIIMSPAIELLPIFIRYLDFRNKATELALARVSDTIVDKFMGEEIEFFIPELSLEILNIEDFLQTAILKADSSLDSRSIERKLLLTSPCESSFLLDKLKCAQTFSNFQIKSIPDIIELFLTSSKYHSNSTTRILLEYIEEKILYPVAQQIIIQIEDDILIQKQRMTYVATIAGVILGLIYIAGLILFWIPMLRKLTETVHLIGFVIGLLPYKVIFNDQEMIETLGNTGIKEFD